jgi:hypothetical protein
VLISKENEHIFASSFSQTINHMWSSSEAINCALSSSKTIILSLDAWFLQPTHPAAISLQSAVPHQQDFLDLDVDHSLSAI